MQQPRAQQLPQMTHGSAFGIPSNKEIAAQAISPAHSIRLIVLTMVRSSKPCHIYRHYP